MNRRQFLGSIAASIGITAFLGPAHASADGCTSTDIVATSDGATRSVPAAWHERSQNAMAAWRQLTDEYLQEDWVVGVQRTSGPETICGYQRPGVRVQVTDLAQAGQLPDDVNGIEIDVEETSERQPLARQSPDGQEDAPVLVVGGLVASGAVIHRARKG